MVRDRRETERREEGGREAIDAARSEWNEVKQMRARTYIEKCKSYEPAGRLTLLFSTTRLLARSLAFLFAYLYSSSNNNSGRNDNDNDSSSD